MNGSWHLGRIAGIDVRIHWTFLLLPIWIYFSSLVAGSGAAAATVLKPDRQNRYAAIEFVECHIP